MLTEFVVIVSGRPERKQSRGYATSWGETASRGGRARATPATAGHDAAARHTGESSLVAPSRVPPAASAVVAWPERIASSSRS